MAKKDIIKSNSTFLNQWEYVGDKISKVAQLTEGQIKLSNGQLASNLDKASWLLEGWRISP